MPPWAATRPTEKSPIGTRRSTRGHRLGFAAEHWGIRWSFGLGLPLLLLSLAVSGALVQRRAQPKP